MFHDDKELYEFSDFRLDISERLLLRKGKRVPLSEKAFEMLCVLVRQSGHLVSKDELLTEVWADTIVEENNLDKNISLLRRVLGERKGKEKFIETVRGRGYRFVAEVRRVESENAVKDENRVTNHEPEKGARQTVNRQTAIRDPQSKNVVALADWRHAPEEAKKPPEEILPAAGITEIPQAKHKNYMPVGAVIFGLLILALGFFALNRFYLETPAKDAPIKSIAVLPFVNASQDANAEYLSDGITESVINNLSQLSGLKVMSRNSAFRFKDNQTDTRNIASQLGVETLVTGNIKQIGDKLIINVRLINASDDSQIWGNQYVKSSADILAAQTEIAQAVVQNLRLKLSHSEQQQLGKNYTENPEAYQLFLKGRYHLLKTTSSEIQIGNSYFQQAIEIDPNFALAYVGLADGYRSLAVAGEMRSTEYLPKAKAAAQKAVEIDDALAEAHAILGFLIFWNDWNWNASEIQYKRALELDPNNADTHLFYGHLLSNTGRHTEALAEAKRARDLDPLNLRTNALEGQFLIYAGQIDEAIARFQKTSELDANYWLSQSLIASAYIEKGMYSEAVAKARIARELSVTNNQPISFLCYALAKSGRQAEARAELNELLKLSTERYVSPYIIAFIYNGLGETDKALEWLEKAYEQRDHKMVFLKVEQKWNSLRNEPRFIELMRRMNF